MKPSLISFQDVQELITTLHEDATHKARFPVRLILVEGLSAWQKVLEHLRSEVDVVLSLSYFCAEEDIYPSAHSIEMSIEEYFRRDTAQKILVLPWGEWLRLESRGGTDYSQSEAFNLLIKLVRKEKVTRMRIYIPLFESVEAVNKVQEQISRYATGEIPPVWRVTGRGFVKVIIAPFAPRHTIGRVVNGLRTYLEYWAQGGAPELVLVTQWTPWLGSRRANFTVEVCRRAYQVLASTIKSWPAKIAEEWGREEDWRWLADHTCQGETFDELAAKVLNVKEYQGKQLFGCWKDLPPVKRWLVWLWSKLELEDSGYVGSVLKQSTDVEQFRKRLIYHVLEEKPTIVEAQERNQFLLATGQQELPTAFLQAVAELPDPSHRLACLLGFTQEERELAVLAVRELLDNNKPEEEWRPYLEIVFPELAWYLTIPPLQERLQEYFELYVRSRLRDRAEPQLVEQAREMAREQALWKYQPRDQVLEELGRGGTVPILWMDGVGVEWLGVLLQAFRAEEVAVDFYITRANLPTITEANKGWQSEGEVERTVDREGHQSPYQYHRVLVTQLKSIRNVVRRAVNLLSAAREVIVTSDHGLTRFAKTSGTVSLPEEAQVHKWGRCAILPSWFSPDLLSSSDSLYYEGRAILLTHERYQGHAGLSGQVHGGATPEEWLVPVIRIRKPARPLTQERLHVHVLTPEVLLNVQGEGELRIELTGYEGYIVQLRVRQYVFTGQQRTKTQWIFQLRQLEPGLYFAILEDDGGKLAEIRFKIVKGLVEDTLGL